MLDWSEKYRPKSLGDIVGNRESVRVIADWGRGWSPSKQPLIIYGKPGTGKTTSAYALANDMGWEVVELNASDQRTKAVIDRIAGAAATTVSLIGSSRKLILLDEADNLQGNADKGGARAIADILKVAQQPVILIANDIYGVAKEIKALCMPVQFRALQARSIVPHLRFICSAEKKSCDDDALIKIAESCGGDMRSAVNMLYAAACGNESALETGSVATAGKDERATIFELVKGVLKSGDDKALMEQSYAVNETPDVVEQWIEGACAQIVSQKYRAEAYGYLSDADTYIGRTYLRQYYMLWRYASALMLLGVSASANGQGATGNIMPPARWGKMSSGRKQKIVRQSVFNKFSDAYHMPPDAVWEDYLKAISVLAERDPYNFAKELSLDKDELGYIISDKDAAASVTKEIQKEQRELEKKAEKAAKEAMKKAKAVSKTKKAEKDTEKTAEMEIGKVSEKAAEKKSESAPSAPSADQAVIEEPAPAEKKEKKPDAAQSTLFSF